MLLFLPRIFQQIFSTRIIRVKCIPFWLTPFIKRLRFGRTFPLFLFLRWCSLLQAAKKQTIDKNSCRVSVTHKQQTVTTRILFFLNINITNIILVLKVPNLPMILNNKVCTQWKWRKKKNFYYHNFISLMYSWSCQLARQTKTCMLSRPLVLPLCNQNETWQQMSKYSKYSVGK